MIKMVRILSFRCARVIAFGNTSFREASVDLLGMRDSLLAWNVASFLPELEACWSDSNKHFKDVEARLVSTLESEKVGHKHPSRHQSLM